MPPYQRVLIPFKMISFKNSKQLSAHLNKAGKPYARIRTNPKYKERMGEITQVLKEFLRPIETPYFSIVLEVFCKNVESVDVDGAVSTVLDCLEDAEIVPNDKYCLAQRGKKHLDCETEYAILEILEIKEGEG